MFGKSKKFKENKKPLPTPLDRPGLSGTYVAGKGVLPGSKKSLELGPIDAIETPAGVEHELETLDYRIGTLARLYARLATRSNEPFPYQAQLNALMRKRLRLTNQLAGVGLTKTERNPYSTELDYVYMQLLNAIDKQQDIKDRPFQLGISKQHIQQLVIAVNELGRMYEPSSAVELDDPPPIVESQLRSTLMEQWKLYKQQTSTAKRK
jgi:hypothetical protein